ncbi:MAG: tetratricopeptide repeat protein [Treponema sp.]|jgi:tetratricopeptide (TPR) repeat protein|nr:tetratricopeptide repeat protein [Treponema sp.]
MKLDAILSKASRLIRSGKYETALRTLEPEVNRYHGSFRYYYLLGNTCLRAGDYGGALTYFRLAHEANSRDPLAVLGLAALYLRRGETKPALDFYLEALELKPNNRIAKKALKLIRRSAGSPDGLTTWLEAGKLPSLFPPVAFPGFTGKEKFFGFLVLLAVAAATFAVLVHLKYLPNPLNPRGDRQGIAAVSLTREERLVPVQSGGSYRYEFEGRIQAVETYEKALSLFAAYRDEAARVNLNRILESNAADSLKNKARIIIDYMKPPYRDLPSFDTFRRSDNINFQDVEKDPVLYRDVHVIWQGRAANVSITNNETSFDLLVDYDPGNKTSIMRGTAFVMFNRAIPLNPGRQLEVLGRIMPSGSDGRVNIEGISIHQSGRLEQ